MPNRKRKLLLTSLVLACVAVAFFLPIIPIKAQVTSGTMPTTPELEKILAYGNFSGVFDLNNFSACLSGVNITAQVFTVEAYTTTVQDKTNGTVTVNMQNVHATIFDDKLCHVYTVDVGSATLNVDLRMEGGYISYNLYADTTSSLAELIQNAAANWT